MTKKTVSEKLPYLTPSMEAVCIRTEGTCILTSIPDVEEEELDWAPRFNDSKITF